ncbi:N-acetylmuramidase domain-containing protein [Hansschlegelia sp.]|uniref:N-acetylmuramidase domain-containing protein n=1 Tax=Hansschlegelia sp. TaxID=2041892 RepID=UPI002CB7EBB0|nr:N-acetylmuramidase domain-containing protein [Hansschlegelia sp.]HVI27634.1 N-acetylmuramidase domain-containing protein [Hansschlegelia sp.]
MEWNGFVGAAVRLDDIDLPREGAAIGVGEDILHAFIDCESRGKGFDAKGRPLILFEPHVFYRELGKGAKRDRAVREGLAYAAWGEKPYPKDSYPRLTKAIAIDETAALMACSWGMFQVMGANYAMIGFRTIQDMVKAMMADEENHLRACIDFLKASGIADDLRQLDATLKGRPVTAAECAPIVRVYNGPGYAKNGYHTKFANSLNRWRKIPDTPLTPAAPVALVETVDETSPAVDLDPDQVRALQTNLRALGYAEAGIPNGVFGPKTAAAVAAFQKQEDLPVSGGADAATLQRLAIARPRPVSDDRASLSTADIRATLAPVQQSFHAKVWAGVTAAGGAALTTVQGAASFFGEAREKLAPVQEFFHDIPPVVWFSGVTAIALMLWHLSRKSEAGQVAQVRSGETAGPAT